MGIKTYNPYTPSRRQMTGSDFSEITKTTPEKSLLDRRLQEKERRNPGNCNRYRVRSEQKREHRSDLLCRRRESIYSCS